MFRLDPHRDSIGAGVARRPEMARKRGQVLKIDNPTPVKIATGIIGERNAPTGGSPSGMWYEHLL